MVPTICDGGESYFELSRKDNNTQVLLIIQDGGKFMKKVIGVLMVLAIIFCAATVFAAGEIERVYLGDLIADKANWEGIGMGNENWKFEGRVLSLLPPDIKSAAYMAKKFKNVELNFDATITWPEDSGDWGSIITVRDFNPGVPVWEPSKTHCYGIMFSENNVKLCKWLNGGSPIDLSVKDGLEINGKKHSYKWTVKDIDGGVNLVLVMDGKEIINIIDNKNPITNEGGIMVMNHGPRSAVYTSVQPSETIAEKKSAEQKTNTNNPKTGEAGTLLFIAMASGSALIIRKSLKK